MALKCCKTSSIGQNPWRSYRNQPAASSQRRNIEGERCIQGYERFVASGGNLANSLRQVMAKLALDPDALARFLKDSESFLTQSELAERDRELLRNPQAGPLLSSLSVDLWHGCGALLEETNPAMRDSTAASGDAIGRNGSLVVVGTGIRSLGQLTVETVAQIKSADRVHYLVAEPIAVEVICLLNPLGARSLGDLYEENKPRRTTYDQMVARILESVRSGWRTCAVFYGHPGVFVDPSHEAIRTARAEGFHAEMLPGVSAEDCLFADLAIDPSTAGCQTYEATDFLANRRQIDPTSHVVIWQAGVLGDRTFSLRVSRSNLFDIFLARLLETYPKSHEICIYQAAVLPGCPAEMQWIELNELDKTKITIISTLYIPPAKPPRRDLDLYMALGGFGQPDE
jgi:siroheme synthase